jgi:DNA-binding beta-propeller fold protein YncE
MRFASQRVRRAARAAGALAVARVSAALGLSGVRCPACVLLLVAALGGAAPAADAAVPPGALRQLDGRAGCFSAKPGDGCPRLRDVAGVEDLAVSPDGRNVYLAGSNSETVVTLARDGRTGALVQLAGPGACVSARPRRACATVPALGYPSAIAVSHDGRNVYVTDDSGQDGVTVFAREPGSGVLSQLPGPAGCVVDSPRDGCTVVPRVRFGRVVVGPDDRQVYVAPRATNAGVVTLSRSPRDGALTPLAGSDGCVSNVVGAVGCRRARGLGFSGPDAIVFSPDGGSAYMPSGSGNVAIFARRAADGALQQAADPLGCVSWALPVRFCDRARALEVANDAVVSPDGRHVYVAAHGVAAFRRDPATGQLTQLSGRHGCVWTPRSTACTPARGIDASARPDDVALTPDGRTLYATHTLGGGGIAVLRRDPVSGALRELPGRAGCLIATRRGCTPVRGLEGPQTVAVSPDGRYTYALGYRTDDAVAVFAVRQPASRA